MMKLLLINIQNHDFFFFIFSIIFKASARSFSLIFCSLSSWIYLSRTFPSAITLVTASSAYYRVFTDFT